jgi:hypothetical protein
MKRINSTLMIRILPNFINIPVTDVKICRIFRREVRMGGSRSPFMNSRLVHLRREDMILSQQ